MTHKLALHLALLMVGCSVEVQSTGLIQAEQRDNRNLEHQGQVCDVSGGKYLLQKSKADAVNHLTLGHCRVSVHNLASGFFGNFWDEAGCVSGVKCPILKKAYMAVVGEKPISIEYIALFSAGQQPIRDGKVTGSILSGAEDNAYTKYENIQLDLDSMTGKFFSCSSGFCFNKTTTLQLSIFDAQFEWGHTKDRKEKMLKGYTNFLLDKINDENNNVKFVYLGGHSRGGCLVAQLAKSLMNQKLITKPKFIVQTFDGVCNQNQGEFGTSETKVFNPGPFFNPYNPLQTTNSHWYAWQTDITDQFQGHDLHRLCIRSILSGDQVIVPSAHAFSHDKCNEHVCTETTEEGWKWYTQEWNKLTHSEMGGHSPHDEEVMGDMVQHFKNCKLALELREKFRGTGSP